MAGPGAVCVRADHPGKSGIPTSYCEALHCHPSTFLGACADPTTERRALFTTRYPGATAYADAEEMLKAERPDVVAIATNAAGRVALTELALQYGAKAIFTVRHPSSPQLPANLHLKALRCSLRHYESSVLLYRYV